MADETLNILFENNDLIAIDKPAGLLSHASVDRERPDALRRLSQFLSSRDGHLPQLGLLHRLDRDTSGVLLFTKRPDVHETYARKFRERTFKKSYLGLVRGKPRTPEWRIENHLALEPKSASKAPRTIAVRSGGDKAITDFKLLKSEKGLSLILAEPSTGRRHQIRAHLQQSGWPLLGDRLYGGMPGTRVLLHAWRLTWTEDGETLTIEAPAPADFFLTPSAASDEFCQN